MSFETYPKPKEQIGPAIWNTLHEIASLYPMEPTRIDRMETKNIIKGIVNRGMPCKECVNDANERFRKLDYTNRKTLYQTLCETHNDVNRKLNKPVVDCSSTLKLIDNHCPTCAVPATQQDDPVGLNINELKRSYQELVKNMAIKEGVPVPEVVFGACPTDPRTSCALYDKNKIGPDGNYTGNDAKIYLNPYNASPRTVFHEMDHYIDLYKGRGHSLSEDKANDYAFSKLNEYFPIKKETTTTPVAMTGATDTVAISADSTGSGSLYNWRQNYPMYQQIENRTFGQNPAPMAAIPVVATTAQQPVPDPNNDFVIQDDGIVKAFEGVGRLPAKWLGISPYDFAMTYVPEALTMTLKSVLGSNTTHFGNWFISLITTMGLFTGSVLLNKSLAYGDRVFMANLTASMLENVSLISNPKIRDGIVSGFSTFVEGITSGDFEEISRSIIELPENSLISRWFNPNKTEFVADSDALDSANAAVMDPTDLSNPLRRVKNSGLQGSAGGGSGLESVYYGQTNSPIGDLNSDSLYDMY